MNNQIKSDIIIYKDINGEIKLDVSLENDTVWLSQKQMELLFDRDKSVISRHIKNIFKEGELDKKSVVAKNATVQKELKELNETISLLQIQRYNEYLLYVNIEPKEAKFVLDFDDCQKRPATKRNRDKSDSKYLGGIDG